MRSKPIVEVTVVQPGLHCWPEAPQGPFEFLRHPHRHRFHVTVGFAVESTGRQLEFFEVQQVLFTVLLRIAEADTGKQKYPLLYVNFGTRSCEDLCVLTANLLQEYCRDHHRPRMADALRFVRVSEDGENAAYIEVTPCPSEK